MSKPRRLWAEIPKQTLLSEKGEVGDCWRCCVAAVVGMPADKVPHFLLDNDTEAEPPLNHCCDADTQRWLNEHGYAITMADKLHWPRWAGCDAFPEVPIIAAGPTERSRGLAKHHAVVMIGDAVVYDPHPSEAGLTYIAEQWLIFWVDTVLGEQEQRQ